MLPPVVVARPRLSRRFWLAGLLLMASLGMGALLLRHRARQYELAAQGWQRDCEQRIAQTGQVLGLEQGMALAIYERDYEGPQAYDWEAYSEHGRFTLHRHVGKFDLAIFVPRNSGGQRFAAVMQPLLDQCLMEAP